LYFIDPNTTAIPLCPLHAMTGLWCPLCGSTRASYALLHADPVTAVSDNALLVLAVPVLAAFLWRRPAAPASPAVLWAVLVLASAFGVLRNLAIGSWLAPPG
jgi:hypothetical protein